MPRRKWSLLLVMLATIGCAITASWAMATETVTYSYDARGRLVKVVHTGTINNNLKVEYVHDKADNRVNVKVTGAPSTP